MGVAVIADRQGAVVVNKQAGIESTGRTVDDPRSLEHMLARQLGARVWAVHQLDRETSGVLVFVRRRSLVAEWQAKLAEGRKFYLAICHGAMQRRRLRIDQPIAYDRRARRFVVRADGREASSIVRRVNRSAAFSLVEVELLTGRTHQARVHLAYAGHPLVGERRYREPPCTLHWRHALHAARIVLADGERFEAPLPDDLRELAERLGVPPVVPSRRQV